MRRAIVILLAVCFLGSSAVFADDLSPQQTAASQFAQRFYDWYTPLAHKHSNTPSWIVALGKRGADFDPGLSRALKEDAEAQRKVSDDIVGLDFDPFLNSQDMDDKYTVGNVTEKDGVFLVSVYGVRKGKRAAKPDVAVELKASKGSFVFTNFRYDSNENLVATLKLLKEQRTQAPQ